jgi:hypothetical protein
MYIKWQKSVPLSYPFDIIIRLYYSISPLLSTRIPPHYPALYYPYLYMYILPLSLFPLTINFSIYYTSIPLPLLCDLSSIPPL